MNPKLKAILIDPEKYAKNFLSISAKSGNIQRFRMRAYQTRVLREMIQMEERLGFSRTLILKPRQAGISTFCSAIGSHRVMTRKGYRGLVMADKAFRTNAIFSLYKMMIEECPEGIRPEIGKLSTEELSFSRTKSWLKSETAKDKNAGRSESRLYAHLSEFAFCEYASDINEGVQNSMPMANRSMLIKETTANGRSGPGEVFFLEWEAAERKESIFKNLFISWNEIDDYMVPLSSSLVKTKEEIEIQKRKSTVTDENLAWRRLKLMEYSASSKITYFTPEERFCQDFPLDPEEAFLHSGRPVFDQLKLADIIHQADRIKKREPLEKDQQGTRMIAFLDQIEVFERPRSGELYTLGADVAEGLEEGDESTVTILNARSGIQVLTFAGKLDADMFGELLVELAKVYNNAIIVSEINAMGIATLAAIKRKMYARIWTRKDVQHSGNSKEEEKVGKWGWRTTAYTKQEALSELIKEVRDDGIIIRDVETAREMRNLNRESDGDVNLNSKDRTVALMLANMGRQQVFGDAHVARYDVEEKEKRNPSRDDSIKR